MSKSLSKASKAPEHHPATPKITGEISLTLSNSKQLRKPSQACGQKWFNPPMHTASNAEQLTQKRSNRVMLSLNDTEFDSLIQTAIRRRLGPAVTARNIVLDFLEGKLVPVEQQNLPGKEVAA